MHELNQRLQDAFAFLAADVSANRLGHITPRQSALIRAASASLRIGIIIFIVVMLGTFGVFLVISFASDSTGSNQEFRTTLTILAIVILAVIIIGLWTSRHYLVMPDARQIQVAQGKFHVTAKNALQNNIRIKIGPTLFLLQTLDQLAAFVEGTEYRIFYLPGTFPFVLSAYVVGTESEFENLRESAGIDSSAKEILNRHRSARGVAILTGLLALGIPLIGVGASVLPESMRWIVFGALFLGALGFVPFALWRMGVFQGRDKES